MGNIFKAIQRGLSAASQSPPGARFTMGGRDIICPLCGHDHFILGQALLNTAGMTFFDLDWAQPSASTLACAECSRIEWFLQTPDRIS